MTKEAALHSFFNSFGIPGYPMTAVPEDAVFPWLTYEPIFDVWNEETGGVSITVNLWYYTTDEAPPNAKAREISTAIGIGGKIIPCDGGYIWIGRGSPWCQTLKDETDSNIKRRYINITAQYLTEN